jgi:hypothetical protein
MRLVQNIHKKSLLQVKHLRFDVNLSTKRQIQSNFDDKNTDHKSYAPLLKIQITEKSIHLP